ncbi:hypothetical protein BDV95DRAFT_501029 [Massariosphaeria phaeospora]|uniref:EthD domain-containing protein n=1 Tax=Massariosphaeria phaeospora TaxID=100035 RepID=A0A7C8M7T7_9PLEO|nr:hypothetical protein BDV95DRAFT_501029 [Massariosphaeria phaeospora]
MSYTVFFFMARKSGITIEQFKDHYENKHIGLVKEYLGHLGDVLPVSHTRYYLKRNEAAKGEADVAPPLVLMGDVNSVDFDCLTIVEFRDEEHFGQFSQAQNSSPHSAELEADRAAFADPTNVRIMVAEGPRVTRL